MWSLTICHVYITLLLCHCHLIYVLLLMCNLWYICELCDLYITHRALYCIAVTIMVSMIIVHCEPKKTWQYI